MRQAPGPAWLIALALGLTAASRAQDAEPTTRPAADPGAPPPLGEAVDFARDVERAHGADAFGSAGALRASLRVEFADDVILDGVLTYHDASGRARIETSDGNVLIFDGRNAWVKADTEVTFGARFQLRAWSYFLTAPFKLRDPGAHLAPGGFKGLSGKLCETAKLTFDAGTGDSPQDWYLLYQDPHGRHLAAMAYIVTAGRSLQDAEAEPHAVVFERHARVQGVLLPVRWTFHEWSAERGVHGAPTGSVVVSGATFVPVNDADFQPVAGMVVDPGHG